MDCYESQGPNKPIQRSSYARLGVREIHAPHHTRTPSYLFCVYLYNLILTKAKSLQSLRIDTIMKKN